MTHPVSDTHIQKDEEIAKRKKRGLVFAGVFGVGILSLWLISPFDANAATSRDVLPAATLATEPATAYPGGDPVRELSMALGSLDIFGSLGSQPDDNGGTPPPNDELLPLDDPASVRVFCDIGQAFIGLNGFAPVAGNYAIKYVPEKDMVITLFGKTMAEGEALEHEMVDPVPEDTVITVILEIQSGSGDTSSHFYGEQEVHTPVCA